MKSGNQVKDSFKKLFQKDKLIWLRWGFVSAAACTPLYMFRDAKVFSGGRGFSGETFLHGLTVYGLIPFIFFCGALGLFELLAGRPWSPVNKLVLTGPASRGILQFGLGAIGWVVISNISLVAYLVIIAFVATYVGPVLFG